MAGPGAGPARKPGLRSGCDRSEEPPREAPEGGGRRERGPGTAPGGVSRGSRGRTGPAGGRFAPPREERREGRRDDARGREPGVVLGRAQRWCGASGQKRGRSLPAPAPGAPVAPVPGPGAPPTPVPPPRTKARWRQGKAAPVWVLSALASALLPARPCRLPCPRLTAPGAVRWPPSSLFFFIIINCLLPANTCCLSCCFGNSLPFAQASRFPTLNRVCCLAEHQKSGSCVLRRSVCRSLVD